VFLIWIVYSPFSSQASIVLMAAILHPFLWLHWRLNSNICCLTLLECKLRGIEEQQHKSFFYNLLAPIYTPQSDDVIKALMWKISIALWIVAVGRLVYDDSLKEELNLIYTQFKRMVPPFFKTGTADGTSPQ